MEVGRIAKVTKGCLIVNLIYLILCMERPRTKYFPFQVLLGCTADI